MNAWKIECHPVGPLQMNAYIVSDEKSGEAMLVDPGDEIDRLLAAIDAGGCRLKHLVCTHGHFDHVGGAAEVQAKVDLPLLCHPADVPLIEHMPEVQASWGFPVTAVPKLDACLSDGATLRLGDGELVVRHVPGHAPGHLLFSWEGNAIVGDLIFAGSVGRTDLPGCSFEDLEQSIRTVVYALPPKTKLHAGHGPATDVESEMRSNPFVRP